MATRRRFLAGASALAVLPLPTWATGKGLSVGTVDLEIGPVDLQLGERRGAAIGINGTVPGPLLRFREGDEVHLRVRNALAEASSIHWHGLLLPSDMDGVPGLSFPGIAPGEHYDYRFRLRQHGTYWYHSHSGLQEQLGVYGPLIIDPAGVDPVAYDVEHVVLLSDWTFEDPWRVFKNLKVQDDYYNRQQLTLRERREQSRERGWTATWREMVGWGRMRMKQSDIADVTGVGYHYLLNGLDPDGNWTGLFEPGQRVRLRIINASAMSFFNVRVPGAELRVVQADGQNVVPVTVDELQIGAAETYDVVLELEEPRAFTIFAEAMDRSGFARGTLAPQAGMTAPVPSLRPPPRLTMRDMGMDHGAESHHGHHHHHGHESSSPPAVRHDHRRGPGVANVTERPLDRLAEPGIGLGDVGHRVLTYADLKSLEAAADQRSLQRTLELHLTGNMERYMWSFDGVKYSEVEGPIELAYNERLRLVLVNDTMMAHPIHLHGMFVELVNGNGAFNPRLHTMVVKPAERLAVDLTANEPGHWAFHCHLLYHMKAGMMRSVRVAAPASA